VFGLAERTSSASVDRTIFAGPVVDILEYVAVYFAITGDGDGQVVRQSHHPVSRVLTLELFKLILVANTLLVPENVSPRIAIGVIRQVPP